MRGGTKGACLYALCVLACVQADADVRQIMRPERLEAGSTNIRALQPVDEASWIWTNGETLWGERAMAPDACFKREYDGLVQNGQVRHLRPGEYWEDYNQYGPPGFYQNGFFWGTPVGWFCWTLERIDPGLVDRTYEALETDYRRRGPYERTFGEKAYCADYMASVALPLQSWSDGVWTVVVDKDDAEHPGILSIAALAHLTSVRATDRTADER